MRRQYVIVSEVRVVFFYPVSILPLVFSPFPARYDSRKRVLRPATRPGGVLIAEWEETPPFPRYRG